MFAAVINFIKKVVAQQVPDPAIECDYCSQGFTCDCGEARGENV